MSAAHAWRLPAACLLLAMAGTAGSAEPAAEAAERQRLMAERRRIDAAHDARERECAERFAVTSCLEENRHQRRDALATHDARLAELDDRQRARRAEARLRRIDAKVTRQAKAREERASSPLLVLPLNAAR